MMSPREQMVAKWEQNGSRPERLLRNNLKTW